MTETVWTEINPEEGPPSETSAVVGLAVVGLSVVGRDSGINADGPWSPVDPPQS